MESEVLRYFRQIPASARILVATGDHVEADTVVAKIEALPGRVVRVNAASTIGIRPRELSARMVRKPGDHVRAGETLAARSEFFERRAVRCPVGGVISAISRNLGYVYVREVVDLGQTTEPVTIHAARALGISPKDLEHYRAPGVKVGALVAKDQVLASIERGPRRHAVATSPVYGRIRDLDLEKGTITVSPVFPSLDVRAYIRGRVTAVIPDEGIEVTGKAVRLEGVWGLGGEAFGTLRVVRGDLISSSPVGQGTILAVQGTASIEALLAARDSGARGAILGYMPSETVLALVGTHGNIGITGDEDVPYPIVVMEGFHPVQMRGPVFSALERHEGETVSIRGVTHIRAGVIRPEVILQTEGPGEMM